MHRLIPFSLIVATSALAVHRPGGLTRTTVRFRSDGKFHELDGDKGLEVFKQLHRRLYQKLRVSDKREQKRANKLLWILSDEAVASVVKLISQSQASDPRAGLPPRPMKFQRELTPQLITQIKPVRTPKASVAPEELEWLLSDDAPPKLREQVRQLVQLGVLKRGKAPQYLLSPGPRMKAALEALELIEGDAGYKG